MYMICVSYMLEFPQQNWCHEIC